MWAIVGHERAVSLLQVALESGTLPHAVLVTGPAGVGKTRLAVELAKTLNCVGDDAPCQRCLHCRQIEGEAHPDVRVIERAAGKESIAIQQVRELREMSSLKPFQGRSKVYIIAGAEALTPQAADALLKTLEEPSGDVTIVLTTTDLDALPETIVSRCRVLSLIGVESGDIARALEERGLEEEQAERLARLAQGSFGRAMDAVQQPKVVAQEEEMIERLAHVCDMSLADRLQLAEQLAGDRKDRVALRRNLELLLLIARDLLLVRQGQAPQLTPDRLAHALKRQSEHFSLEQLHALLQNICLAMERVDANVDARLAMEALLVGVPQGAPSGDRKPLSQTGA